MVQDISLILIYEPLTIFWSSSSVISTLFFFRVYQCYTFLLRTYFLVYHCFILGCINPVLGFNHLGPPGPLTHRVAVGSQCQPEAWKFLFLYLQFLNPLFSLDPFAFYFILIFPLTLPSHQPCSMDSLAMSISSVSPNLISLSCIAVASSPQSPEEPAGTQHLSYYQLIQLAPYPPPITATAPTAAPVGPLPRQTLLIRETYWAHVLSSLHRIIQYKGHTPPRLQLFARKKLPSRVPGLPPTISGTVQAHQCGNQSILKYMY